VKIIIQRPTFGPSVPWYTKWLSAAVLLKRLKTKINSKRSKYLQFNIPKELTLVLNAKTSLRLA
jgi:hypothetical protein